MSVFNDIQQVTLHVLSVVHAPIYRLIRDPLAESVVGGARIALQGVTI